MWSAPTTPTWGPLLRTTSVSPGISRGGFLRGVVRSTCAYMPGSRRLPELGTCTSVSRVRVAGSSALAVRVTAPTNWWPARSEITSRAIWPTAPQIRVGLRNVHVDAQAVRLGDPEKQRVGFVDQRADIYVAHRNHARERRAHALITLQFGKTREVGLRRDDVAARGRHRLFERQHIRLCRHRLGLVRVVLLARHDAFGLQVLPPVGGDFGELLLRLSLLQVGVGLFESGAGLVQGGPRLIDLLIQFRRFDFGQQLAGLHAVTDIRVAPLDV